MTREEALDIIRFVFLHTDNHLNDDRQISADDIHEALVMACATLCKNSLPSEIDKAAEKYSENILAKNEDLQDAIEDGFKAGAEWMAGQGETKRGVATQDHFIQFADDTYIDLDPTMKLIPAFKLKDAEKIVVQIRKK